ncbi:tas, partial [Symbiodinium pilosum]
LAASEGMWEAQAAALPSLVFPGRLVSKTPKVQSVHQENAQVATNLTANPSGLVGKPLLPHTDGYIYGASLPDYIAFLVESPADAGGESYVVDGKKVVDRLCGDGADDMCSWAQTLAVDFTERAPLALVNGREFAGPLMWWQHDRLRFHRQTSIKALEDAIAENGKLRSDLRPYQSLWAPLGAPEGEDDQLRRNVSEMLKAVDIAVQEETALAYRFAVHEGEALLLDNYRMLHGREGYTGRTQRKLWRVWFWTNASSGIPEGMPELGTFLDAELIKAHRTQ